MDGSTQRSQTPGGGETEGPAERNLRILAAAIRDVREGVMITEPTAGPQGHEIVYVNDCCCEITGYSRDELVGRTPRLLYGPRTDLEQVLELRRTVGRHGSFNAELVFYRKDGSEYVTSLHVSPVIDAAGQATHFVALQQDVTEKKRSEQALRESEARYRQLIEQMSQGFVATDASNRMSLVNDTFARMLGRSRKELEGRPVGEFVPDSQREHLEAQEQRRHEGGAEPYELTFVAKDGRRVESVVAPTPLLDGEGRFQSSFAVITDVTERKHAEAERRRLEERMQQAQKLETLGVLAGGIAHDFNNLLVGILGNAGLALQELGEGSPVKPIVEQIETAAVRASELTRQILAYSGKGNLVVEPIDLGRLVEEMAHLLRATINKKTRLVIDVGAERPAVEGDATQIRQVVMNLITNASEALEDTEGEIRVTAGRLMADEPYLAGAYLDEDLPAGAYAYLEVRDDGRGMDAATTAKIFDPFFTTKEIGHGLGLAAVLGIVRGHRGFIRVESAPGSGTAFRVHFPAVGPAEGLLVEGVERGGEVRGSGLVLVADDEAAVRNVARAALERAGFAVLLAEDGREAVEVFERHGGEVDAVLLDVTMPRMSGDEAFRAIRAIRGDARIVLTSGFSEQDAVEGCSIEGLSAFLQKPFRPQELLEVLRGVLAD